MVVFLIGLRGAGKSTVGRLVAARLGASFVDLDDETARVLGFASASEALRARGLEAFRQAEMQALRGVLGRGTEGGQTVILALGGGTPMTEGAVDVLLAQRGAVVYLRASAAELQERLRRDPHQRPSLTGGDPIDEVPLVLTLRDEFYQAIAGVVIQTGGLTPQSVADRVVDALA